MASCLKAPQLCTQGRSTERQRVQLFKLWQTGVEFRYWLGNDEDLHAILQTRHLLQDAAVLFTHHLFEALIIQKLSVVHHELHLFHTAGQLRSHLTGQESVRKLELRTISLTCPTV